MGPVTALNKYVTLDEFCHAGNLYSLELELANLLNESAN
jgi:hypothetical protein